MCTALSLNTAEHYFGRTLDIDRSYGEQVVIVPRRFPLNFRQAGELSQHYAMIGIASRTATVVNGYPLLYDAANERGLAMAGLNFPHNAHYSAEAEADKDNIASFELIPRVLGQCADTAEARALLSRINITAAAFSEDLPPSPLHWIISDARGSLTLEAMSDGLHIYENSEGILTNNPPFLVQLENLKKYAHLRADNKLVAPEEGLPYSAYCQGLGAVGLPGDASSMSRFVRIWYGRKHSVCGGDEESAVGQFFHLMSTVEMVRGSCVTDEGQHDITLYTSCINTRRGLYYYTTYGNRRICCIDMHRADLDDRELIAFPLMPKESIKYQN